LLSQKGFLKPSAGMITLRSRARLMASSAKRSALWKIKWVVHSSQVNRRYMSRSVTCRAVHETRARHFKSIANHINMICAEVTAIVLASPCLTVTLSHGTTHVPPQENERRSLSFIGAFTQDRNCQPASHHRKRQSGKDLHKSPTPSQHERA
jgi:hypothetical protein